MLKNLNYSVKKVLIILTLTFGALIIHAQDTQEVQEAQEASFNESGVFTSSIEENKVTYYPNPAVENLNVFFSNYTLKSPKITIHSLIGNEIKTKIENRNEGYYQINVEKLPAGYYFLAINDPKSNYKKTFKFLKRD